MQTLPNSQSHISCYVRNLDKTSTNFNHLDFSTSVLVKFPSLYLSFNTTFTIMNPYQTKQKLNITVYQKVVGLNWGRGLNDVSATHCHTQVQRTSTTVLFLCM